MIEGLFSPMHLIIILAIALMVLGPKRLPDAGRGLGEAIRGFKDSLADHDDERDQPARTPPTATPSSPEDDTDAQARP
jgi:sec-independent protein translocase protein TatA